MKYGEKMFESKADQDRNRLYVTLKGRLTAKEIKQAVDRVFEDLKTMKPDFDVITDISEFEPVTQSDAEILVQIHQKMVDLGVGRIVRIAGESLKSVVGKVQFDRVSRRTNIAAQYFDSVEDAEYFLDYLAVPG
jgi:hypothetical protein